MGEIRSKYLEQSKWEYKESICQVSKKPIYNQLLDNYCVPGIVLGALHMW